MDDARTDHHAPSGGGGGQAFPDDQSRVGLYLRDLKDRMRFFCAFHKGQRRRRFPSQLVRSVYPKVQVARASPTEGTTARWADYYPTSSKLLYYVFNGGEGSPIQENGHAGRDPMGTTRIPLSAAASEQQDRQANLEMSTAELGLNVRTTNCLEERGIFTVRDLLRCTRQDLLGISNFGEKTLEEVYKALEGIGFYRTSRKPPAEQYPMQPR